MVTGVRPPFASYLELSIGKYNENVYKYEKKYVRKQVACNTDCLINKCFYLFIIIVIF